MRRIEVTVPLITAGLLAFGLYTIAGSWSFAQMTDASRSLLPPQEQIVAAQEARERIAASRRRLVVSRTRSGDTRIWASSQCTQSGDTVQIIESVLDREGSGTDYWNLSPSEIRRLRDEVGYSIWAYAPGKWMFSGPIPAREGSRMILAASSDPALQRPWDFASTGRPQIACFYGYMLLDREPISQTLRRATRPVMEWVESDSGKQHVRLSFSLDTGEYELLCNPKEDWLIVRAIVTRGATHRSGDRALWKLLRSPALDPEAPGKPTQEELNITEEVTWQLEETVQEEGTWIPRSGRGKVARKGHPEHTFDLEYLSDLVSSGDIVSPHDLWTSSLGLVPDRIEATILTDWKTDGLYREWRDGKPVVVERPKVQEKIEEAVQQAPAGTRAPESGRAQLYLLLTACTLLIAVAVGLSLYRALARR